MLTTSQVADWMLAKAEQNNVSDVTSNHSHSTIESTECVYFTDAELSAMDEALSSDEQLADARKLLGIC